jgi:hypothetical protein
MTFPQLFIGFAILSGCNTVIWIFACWLTAVIVGTDDRARQAVLLAATLRDHTDIFNSPAAPDRLVFRDSITSAADRSTCDPEASTPARVDTTETVRAQPPSLERQRTKETLSATTHNPKR